MSAEFVTLGPDMRARVNGTFYGVIGGQLAEQVDKVENTDSEFANDAGNVVTDLGGGFQTFGKAAEVGLAQLTVTLKAQRQSNVFAHTAPLDLVPARGSFIHLELFQDGVAAPLYDIPTFKMDGWDSDWNIQGSAPQSISFHGRSHGGYTRPGH